MKENTGATTQLNTATQPKNRNTASGSPSLQAERESEGEVRPPASPLRHEGGQPGNQNARVHGFYSKRAPLYRQDVIDEAAELQGLDGEISFLRSCIEWVAEMDPPNPKLAGELVRTLSIAMVRRKYACHFALIDKAKKIVGGFTAAVGAAGGVAQIIDVSRK